MIKQLHKEYIQKSRIFLYPLLDIQKGSEAVPVESYVSWTGKFSPDSCRFVCTYYLRDDMAFVRFEKAKLTGNKLFHSFYETEDNLGVYVFNFEDYHKDWNAFMLGGYSKMSPEVKNKILKFFLTNKATYHHINSYLNPEIYFEHYAKLLNVSESLLREVGELCSIPDFEKETLHALERKINIFEI
ncbi:hypothetical protein EB118_06620 [bacterium]|nr:hypothetical protein [bacterium]NDD82702.1 hypothetical protein [bacterium]NDG29752.1 hypothetical protein [bacterium]